MSNQDNRYKYAIILILIILFLVMRSIDVSLKSNVNDNYHNFGDDIGPIDYGGGDAIQRNFELKLGIISGDIQLESFAYYTSIALEKLGIYVPIIEIPLSFIMEDNFTDFSIIRRDPSGLIIGHQSLYGPRRFAPRPTEIQRFHTENKDMENLRGLSSEIWKENQKNDMGISSDEIDELLEYLYFESNDTIFTSELNNFINLYYDKLLYELPLTTINEYLVLPKGYMNYSAEEGILTSRMLGSYWSESSNRDHNSSTMSLDIVPRGGASLDRMGYMDTGSFEMLKLLQDPLLFVDSVGNSHPAIAYNYIGNLIQDYNDSGDAWEYTFLLDKDAMWQDIEIGNIIYPSHPITANDFITSLQYYDNPLTQAVSKPLYMGILGYNSSSTLYENDTLTIFVNGSIPQDQIEYSLANLRPLPSHLLNSLNFGGENYTLKNYPGIITDNARWKELSQLGVHQYVGQYSFVDYNINNGEYSYIARSDYWYPNEMRSITIYSQNNASFSAMENRTGYTLNTFAPHRNLSQDPYYWNGINSQSIKVILFQEIDHITEAYSKFQSGYIDSFSPNLISDQVVINFDDFEKYDMYDLGPGQRTSSMIFNMKNSNLMKYNIRRAISSALDMNIFAEILESQSVIQENIISFNYDAYYSAYPFEYDLELAKDLMRAEGYEIDIPVIITNYQPERD